MIPLKVSFCFALALVAAGWTGLPRADGSIIGKWSGTDSDGDTATFVLNADNSAEVKFEGVPRLSTQTMTNGNVTWASDTTQDPMHVDIVIVRASTEVSRIRMIAQLVDAQTLKLQISRNMTTRPTSFAMTDDVFQLLATRQ